MKWYIAGQRGCRRQGAIIEPQVTDVDYVEQRSLLGDIWIMLRTPWAILARRGAV